MRFGIETKGHSVVPIFPSKHFVGTQPRVGETKRAIWRRGVEDDHSGSNSTVRRCVRQRTSVTLREALASLSAYPIKLHLANCVCQQRLIAAENVTRL